MRKMVRASADARSDLLSEGDCDLKELVKFAKGLEQIGQVLSPKLVMRPTPSDRWEPDLRARLWVASAIELANTYQDQTDVSDLDTNIVLGMVSVALFPLTAIDGGAVGIASMTASAAEFTIQVSVDTIGYFESKQELVRALGLSLVVGDARLRRAEQREKTLGALLANTGMNLLSFGLDGVGYAQFRGVARGADLAGNIKSVAHLEALTPLQRADFEAFVSDIARVRDAKGTAALSPEQARIYDLFAARPKGAARAPSRPDPFVPSYVVRPSGDLPPMNRTPADIAAIRSAGQSPDSIYRLMPIASDTTAPTRALAATGDPAEQLILDTLDQTFSQMLKDSPANTVEYFLSRQNLATLRNAGASVIFREDLGSVGAGVFDQARGRYLIFVNAEKLAGEVHGGIRWGMPALFAHEGSHMIQVSNSQAYGVIIGRALREYDATLRMAVVQNMHSKMRGAAEAIGAREALEFSLDYALEVQWKAFLPGSKAMPYFGTPKELANGLFQLPHTEAVARARVFFPSLKEAEILDVFLAVQQKQYAAYGDLALANPVMAETDLLARFTSIIQAAKARRAQLP